MATLAQVLKSAQAHLEAGRLEEARQICDRLEAQGTGSAEVAIMASRVAFEAGDAEASLAHLRTALERAADNPRLWLFAAERYRHFNLSEDALAAYDKTIALSPKALKPRVDRAHYLQILGRFETAEKAFRKLIKSAPNEPELYRIAMPTLTLKPADPIRRDMARLWADKRLPDMGRMHLGYALASAEADPGRMFRFLDKANAMQAKLAPFDPDALTREYKAVLAAQPASLPLASDGAAPAPIFVIGMPRSGTTLVEQILAAHSNVRAGGEMRHALATAYAQFGAAEAMRPPASADALAAFAARYQRLVQRDTAPRGGPDDAPRFVTDKSITTHMIVGLLHAALPSARFVVVLRDPRDIALSIYRNYFALGTHRYSARLGDIAHMIKAFRANIAHWQDRFPGLLHVVRYEDLVSEPEATSRALISAVGLDWQDACLSFHKTAGPVQTLSLAQVRQPIHAGRKQAWRKFETHLKPFVEAWGAQPWD